MFSLPDISGDYFLQPIVLYIVQVLIITLLTRFLSKVLKYFKQPTVIAEMVAGILLGPSVLGRIPGFANNFFPERSLRILEVNADMGLILYIFMVGTQIDFSLLENFTFSSFMGRTSHSSGPERVGERESGSVGLQHSSSGSSNIHDSASFLSSLTHIFQLDIRRWRSMVGIPALLATAGVIIPFLCGFGFAWPLFNAHHQVIGNNGKPEISPLYRGKDQNNFAPFGLFIGVAMAMSALAVLARMLTERRMLHQPVGTLALTTSSVCVLETWIVMGLATSFTELDYNPLDVFWSILTVISDLILLLAVLKPILSFIVRRVEREQEMSVMNFFSLIAIALGFAALCEVNGLTSSLGAMLVGMALPRTNGGQITRQALSERLEDLTSLFFLPLFFTISGIRTNFKLLHAVDWGVCFLMFFIAFVSKAGTLGIVSRLFNILSFREAVSYGVLMQSKGLLALIIFNDAKTADIISDEMFSILVTYVLLSSAITLPIVDWIYLPQRLYKPSHYSDNTDQHSTLVVATHPRQVRAMVSIVTAFVKPVSMRERDQPPDRIVTAKLLKDTTRFSAPFTSLSLRKDAVQKSYIRRDNVMSAARKRFSDLNLANGPLRLEQQLYVTANVADDLTEIAQSNMSDLILISGPESSVLPTSNVGLPTVSLTDAELLEFSRQQSPCDTAIFYDRGPLLQPHVGRVLCAVVLGLERESITALRLCARMRPKVEVEVLHIVAPGIGDNLELLNTMIAICTQKSMSYRVVINSNPMAAVFEELNNNSLDPDREIPEEYYMDPNHPYYANRGNGDKRPYSLLVVGALPPHLSNFLISNATCSVLMVYPKHIGHAKPAENPPPCSPPLLASNDDLDSPQPTNHASVSLMSIVAGASAPQVIPSAPSPATAAPTRTTPPTHTVNMPPTSPPQPLSPPLPQQEELSPFGDWPSPTTSPAKLHKTPSKKHKNASHILTTNPPSDSEDNGSLITRVPSANNSRAPSSSKAFYRRSSMIDFPSSSSSSMSHIPQSHLSTRNVNLNPYPEPPVSLPPTSPNLTIVGHSINNPDHSSPSHTPPSKNNTPEHTDKIGFPPSGEAAHVTNKNVTFHPTTFPPAEKPSPPNPFLDPISPFGNPDLPPRTFPPAQPPSTSISQPPTPTQTPGQPIFPTPTQSHTLPPNLPPSLSHAVPHSLPLSPPPSTPIDNKPKIPNPFMDADALPVFPGSSPAELPRHLFGAHFDFTVPTARKSAAQLLCELPLDIWSQICTHLNLAEVAAVTRVCPALHRTMAHNTVWCAIATARWPESQSNATAGINWKQLCLLYHSKAFPHLVLRDYAGTARGKFHLISCMFIGDDSEMGGAESVFFLNKISKNSAVSRASMKANVMTLEYSPYYFLTVSLSQLNKIGMPFDRSSAIVVTILTRSSQNTNVETVLPKRYVSELNTVLQEAGPTSPLIVFFHFNPVANAPNSDSTFVQKLVGVFHGLILKSPHPFRKLLVQPYNFRSGSGFSDGLWWMVSNIPQPPTLLREEVLLSVTRL